MIQLYRCNWLTDVQRSNVLCALNSMQEKSTFMGISDLPLIRNIEPTTDLGLLNTSRQANLSSQRKSSINTIDQTDLLSQQSIGDHISNLLNSKPTNLDNKHDTRIVNEAFQVNHNKSISIFFILFYFDIYIYI